MKFHLMAVLLFPME